MLQSVRGKCVNRLSVSAVVTAKLNCCYQSEPATRDAGQSSQRHRCQVDANSSQVHRFHIDACRMLKSTQNRFLGVLEPSKIDAKTIQGCSRATSACPKSFEGRSGASPVRPGSVPKAPQGCLESAQRRPGTLKRPSKSAGKRTEAIQIDATSVLGLKKSSFFAQVTRKARSERHSVDFR